MAYEEEITFNVGVTASVLQSRFGLVEIYLKWRDNGFKALWKGLIS